MRIGFDDMHDESKIPSDLQMTFDQTVEVERQYDLARAEMLEEERKTEAIEPTREDQ